MISYTGILGPLLERIVSSDPLHALWLNTLSYLENCGARKIARSEHPRLVKEEMLKHAAEEFRHAHYLKRQIKKITAVTFDTYSLILGGIKTVHYLNALDLQAVRILKELKIDAKEAYLFVTYAIEMRASELYPLYDKILKNAGSKVAVKSIVLEEEEHLLEMKEGIKRLPLSQEVLDRLLPFESALCKEWLDALCKELLIIYPQA